MGISSLYFDAAITNREACRYSTRTSSGAAQPCGAATPRNGDTRYARLRSEGSLHSLLTHHPHLKHPPVRPCEPLCAILRARPSVCSVGPVFDERRAFVQRCANGLTEAFFEGSDRISARSILCKIKGRSRLRARPAHKAPQCGAFHEFKTAVGISLSRTIPQSVLRKASVCQAFATFLTAPAERK